MLVKHVDLNLLEPLEALLDERHVSRAAERVHLTQPAMSRTLARLRRELGDELLVRGRDGYSLTPRAERLQRELVGLLPQVRSLFEEDGFDPATAEETYRLAGTDYVALLFGPPLFRRVRRDSPGSRMELHGWSPRVFEDLERGALDIVFYGVAAPAGLRAEELFEERFVCLVDASHRLADRGALPLDAYLSCAHVLVEVDGGEQTVIERQLSAHGTRRDARLRVPYHAAAAAAVRETDLVATLPARLLPTLDTTGLIALEAPAEIATMSYLMSWHPRLDSDPAHAWLRQAVRDAIRV